MAMQDSRSNRVSVKGLDFMEIRELVNKKPGQIIGDATTILRTIGAGAVRDMRDTITNEDGVTKIQQRGERKGRVRPQGDSTFASRPRVGGKSMRDSVDYQVRVNKSSVSLRFGWINGRPGYAFFQEYGTSNGVPAMHALTDAKAKATSELQNHLRRLP
jgi:hypothetical protein